MKTTEPTVVEHDSAKLWSPDEARPVERINGKDIRVGTLDEFVQEIFGTTLEKKGDDYPVMPAGLMLGIEKFKECGNKMYRLIWLGRGKGWLTAENTDRFRHKRDAVAAGRTLSEETGAYFSEFTRSAR